MDITVSRSLHICETTKLHRSSIAKLKLRCILGASLLKAGLRLSNSVKRMKKLHERNTGRKCSTDRVRYYSYIVLYRLQPLLINIMKHQMRVFFSKLVSRFGVLRTAGSKHGVIEVQTALVVHALFDALSV